MTDLAKLVVRLEAETAQYQRQLDSANRHLDKYKRDAEDAGKGIADSFAKSTAAIAAGIAAIGGSALAFAKQGIDAIDALGDAAEGLSIPVEQLSELSYVAKLSGVEFDSLTTSTRKFNEELAKAAQGDKAATALFKGLGVSVTDANGKVRDLESVLLDVADRFATYEDGAEKAALAGELFGQRTGGDMLRVLNQGSEGIKQLTKEARDFGLVISQDVAAQAGEFNDKLDRADALIEGFKIQLAAKLVPTLSTLEDSFFGASDKADKMSRSVEIAATAGKLLATGAIVIKNAFLELGNVLGGTAAAISKLYEGGNPALLLNPLTGPIEQARLIAKNGEQAATIFEETLADAKSGLTKGLDELNQIWSNSAKGVETSVDRMNKAAGRIRPPRITGVSGKQESADDIYQEFMKGLEQELDVDFKANQKRQEENAALRLSLLSEQDKATQNYIETLLKLEEAEQAGIITESERLNKIAELDDGMKKFNEDTKEMVDRQNEFWRAAAEGIQQSFSGLFEDILNGELDSWDEFGDGVVKALNRIAAEALAAQAASAIFGEDFASGKQGSSVGGWLGELGSLASSWWGAHDAGGFIPSGKFGIVGEKGPEFVSGPAMVTSRSDTAKALAGGSGNPISITIVNPQDAASIQRSLPQLQGQLTAAVAAGRRNL